MRTSVRLGFAFAAIIIVVGTAAMAVDFNSQCYQNTNHEIFVSGLKRFTTLKNSDGVYNKTKYSPAAGSVGYRYSTPQWSAGLAFSYEGGQSKNYFEDGHIRISDDTLGVTLFGRYTAPTGWYASSALFIGFNRIKTRGGQVTGFRLSSDGSEDHTYFGASVELGRRFEFGDCFRFTPHVGIDYSYAPATAVNYYIAGISDGNTMSDQNFFEIPVGVAFAKDIVTCDWVITPSLDLTMVSSIGGMGQDSYNFRSGSASYDGSQWRVYGVGADHWGARVTAGIKAVKSERFDMGINYTYEGRKDFDDHRIMAGLGFTF
ncbi:MAG: autotransporter outer membrane beta-barrel domain-containing protein [Planctomycetes bacterium]|nr:autotransporter outer membrane beta-barrel domain-containing protein [Planctomycetota bacterium]